MENKTAKTEFKNVKEVAQFLNSEGWKVAQSTVYKHRTEGLIRPDADGNFTRKAVLKYARLYLKQTSTDQKIKEDELSRKDRETELALKEEKLKRERMKRMYEEGQYFLRDELDIELAARAATLEAGMKYMVQTKAGAWINMVGGNEEMITDFIREIHSGINEALNEFASLKEFQVILKANEQIGRTK